MKEKTSYKNLKSFVLLTIFLSVVFILIFFIINHKDSKTDEKNSTKTIEIKEIGDDFLYYNGDVYYNNRNLSIISDEDVGQEIGTVEYHLKFDDIKNNTFKYFNDNKIYAYAVKKGTVIYSHKKLDNVILVPTEYNYHNYYVYTKDMVPSDFHDFNYYINNPDEIQNIKFVSIGDKEIPINLSINDFFINENAYSISSSIPGFLPYYLLIEENGLYLRYEGTGNIFLNDILLDINNKQYIYENDNLSNILKELFPNYPE